MRAATEAPEPLELPPVTRLLSQGLRQWPWWTLWPVGPAANSAMLRKPSSTTPAASSFFSTVAVVGATQSRRIALPPVEISPAR